MRLYSAIVVTMLAIFVLGIITPLHAANVALGASATANSVYADYCSADKAVDGDETTNWSASSTGSTSNPYWLIVDLGTVFQVSDVVLKSRDTSTWSNDYYEHYNLFTAVTSGDWIYRASGTLIDDPVLFFNTIDLAGTGVRWLKFEVDGGKHWAHLYEMEVNAVPVPPSVLLLLPGLLGLGILRGRFQSNS